MKTLSFAIAGVASLALAACGGRSEEAIEENIAAQSENLDALSANAANQAEIEALGTQEQQLETAAENGTGAQNAAAAVENEDATEDEEPVQGM